MRLASLGRDIYYCRRWCEGGGVYVCVYVCVWMSLRQHIPRGKYYRKCTEASRGRRKKRKAASDWSAKTCKSRQDFIRSPRALANGATYIRRLLFIPYIRFLYLKILLIGNRRTSVDLNCFQFSQILTRNLLYSLQLRLGPREPYQSCIILGER